MILQSRRRPCHKFWLQLRKILFWRYARRQQFMLSFVIKSAMRIPWHISNVIFVSNHIWIQCLAGMYLQYVSCYWNTIICQQLLVCLATLWIFESNLPSFSVGVLYMYIRIHFLGAIISMKGGGGLSQSCMTMSRCMWVLIVHCGSQWRKHFYKRLGWSSAVV